MIADRTQERFHSNSGMLRCLESESIDNFTVGRDARDAIEVNYLIFIRRRKFRQFRLCCVCVAIRPPPILNPCSRNNNMNLLKSIHCLPNGLVRVPFNRKRFKLRKHN